MLNYNGNLLQAESVPFSTENRAFKYGDAVFTTVKAQGDCVIFWEDHYFRLMASMRMLRMEIPMRFTLEFLEQEILKTTRAIRDEEDTAYRVRVTVYRKDGGLYAPLTNQIDYLITVTSGDYQTKKSYVIDLYKDFYSYSGWLSTVKTNNRMLNTLASIYMSDNELNNCILLNERKGVVEAINGNIFVLKEKTLKTPALEEGCIQGIIRKKVIEIVEKNTAYTVEQTTISPFELQKATEVFITNTIIGIQSVTQYRKKIFDTTFAKELQSNLHALYKREKG